jgi:CRISPR/Cas system-associated exonuclease Cas4 (RecB family)
MDYAELIEKRLRESLSEERGLSKNLGVSSAGQCHYKRIKETVTKKEVDDRALRLFWLGNAIHDKIQALIEGQKEVHIRGTFLTPEFHEAKENEEGLVSGKIDILVDNTILEIKTVHSRSFSYEVSEHYLYQLLSYVEMYSILSGKVPDAGLIYVSRDDMRIAYLPISIAAYSSVREELIKDWQTLEREFQMFRDIGVLPEPKPKWDWECKYCPFALDCPVKPDLQSHVNRNIRKNAGPKVIANNEELFKNYLKNNETS